MKARILLAAAALLLVLPAAARAATLSVENGVLRLDGSADTVEADIWEDGGAYTVYDYSGTIEAGKGCGPGVPDVWLNVPPYVVDSYQCSGPVQAVDARLGDEGNGLFAVVPVPVAVSAGSGADYVYADGRAATVSAGAGDDFVATGDGDDVVDAGAGEDRVLTWGGADRIAGGPGADDLFGDPFEGDDETPLPEQVAARSGRLAPFALRRRQAPGDGGGADVIDGGDGADVIEGGPGPDRVLGGAGRDTVVYDRREGVALALDGAATGGPGEGDAVLEVESARTRGGDDQVTGTDASNAISTGPGNDVVDPRGGLDLVATGEGDDTVHARDGAPDEIDCGEGSDRVAADPEDTTDASCEAVERAPLPTPGGAAGPLAPAGLSLALSRARGALVVRGRLALPAGADTRLCDGGGVRVTVRGMRARPRTRATLLDTRCRFTVRVRGARRGMRVRVSARFAGTPGIGPAAAARSARLR